MNPLFVVVGMPGSGKSTVVGYLAKNGWPVVYFGQITLDEMKRRGLPPSPESEKQVRESLRQTYGNAAYAQMSLASITRNLETAPCVVDGLYSWEEYKFLRARLPNPAWVIAVCARRQIRYARLAKRTSRPLTCEQAEARDFAEIENIQKGGPIAIADYTLLNDDSQDCLEAAAGRTVSSIMASSGSRPGSF